QTRALPFFAMANSGLLGPSGFIGEFTVIMGAVEFNFWIGLLTATALITGASYSLWMLKRVAYGPIKNPQVENLQDVSGKEFLALGHLDCTELIICIYTKTLTDELYV